MDCEYLEEVIEKYDRGEEPTNNMVMTIPFAVAEPKKVEGTDDEYEEANFCLTILLCKCGAYHIFPSVKTVIEQISEIITKSPQCAKCGPYYLCTDPYNEDCIGEPILNDNYLVNWHQYQSPKANCEFIEVDKSRQVRPFKPNNE